MSDARPPAEEPRREREVIVTNGGGGGGGGAVAAVVAVVVLLIVLFFVFQSGIFSGDSSGDSGDTTVVEAPDVDVPDDASVDVEVSDGGGDEG